MKKIIAACIDRVIEFDSYAEAATYVDGMRNKKKEFVILSRQEIGGKLQIRIREQYNNNPMIED